MARLIDLLLRERLVPPLPVDKPVIIGDEQLAFIDALPDDHPRWAAEDFPNMAPPFAHWWIEARSGVSDIHYGVSFVVRHEDPGTHEILYRYFWDWYPLPGQIKWMIQATCFMRQQRLYGMLPQSMFLFVGDQGQVLNPNHPDGGNLLQGLSHPSRMPATKLIALTTEQGLEIIPFALRTWAMMNCVNVGLDAVAPPAALSKSHAKKYGLPMSSWYELKLKARKYAQAEASTERDDSGDRRRNREHLVRGHFKRRQSGVYWWNAHVRGLHDLGTIRKSYTIPS